MSFSPRTANARMQVNIMGSTTVSYRLLLVAVILLDVSSAFRGTFHKTQNPLLIGRSSPLLDTMNEKSQGAAVLSMLVDGMEGDPLEEDRRQRNRKLKRYVSPQHGNSDPSNGQGEEEDQKSRLVRPKSPQNSSANDSDSYSNERKATTSTVGGVNMELKDPKERRLVRHATASSAYGVDDFKGKKKKIIKPWQSGRKKHRNKQSNIGGLGREAYGEELKVELKNQPKNKRLVMARSNTSGNQDAAKLLISGGTSKAEITAQDIAEEKRLRNRRKRDPQDKDRELYYDDEDEQEDEHHDIEGTDGEPQLVQLTTSMVKQQEEDDSEGPNLVRLSTSMVRPPNEDNADKPNLVRMSSSIVREPDDQEKDEPNLVRLESSIVREPEEEPEGPLKFYSRADASEDEQEDGQRLVRAVRVPPTSTSDEPKLMRPNFVKARDTGPKLTRPNFVKAREGGPKLVRPNLVKARSEGPKLVRANVKIEKTEENNLVRAKIVAESPSNDSPKLVSPRYISEDSRTEDFMYGANAAASNPTAVPLQVRQRKLVKPSSNNANSIKTSEEELMYGSGSSSVSPTSVPVNSKPKRFVRASRSVGSDVINNLMYGSRKATASPTAVGVTDLKLNSSTARTSVDSSPMHGLMYGASQAVAGPTSVPVDTKQNREGNFVKSQTGASVSSPMDDLMYGYKRATSSPIEAEIKAKAAKLVKPIENPDSEEGTQSMQSTTIFPDGDRRKVESEPRLVRASSHKRYVKPSASIMTRVPDWDAAVPPATTTNPTFVKFEESGEAKHHEGPQESKLKKFVRPSTSVMNSAPDWDAVQSVFAGSNPVAVNVGKPMRKYVQPTISSMNDALDWDHANPPLNDANPSVVYVDGAKTVESDAEGKRKKYSQPWASSMKDAPDWDHAKPASSTDNPSVLNVDAPKSTKESFDDSSSQVPKKKYVQPSTSSMENAPDWDAVKPALSTDNPSVVSVVAAKPKDEPEPKASTDERKEKRKKYIQPSTSLMENAPDWDAVKPALSTDNPSVVSVVAAKPKDEPEPEAPTDERKEKRKKYIQPSTSLMENAPDWDAVKPALSTDNPSVVSVVAAKPKDEPEPEASTDERKEKRKKYIQPSTSLMENAPDWDAVKPALSTDNPSVVSVVAAKPKDEPEPEASTDERKEKRKKYIQPSTSLMENAPDWDAVKPALSTDNPSVVSVVLPTTRSQKTDNDVKIPETTKKDQYVKPSVSLMADVPDWNSVQPATSLSNPAVVNVDGINRIGQGKRLVRPSSSNMETGIENETQSTPADTPFEYKQIQSIPDENPAGAKPIQDEETKTKLPAAIAHAAGSSSDGWTPSAHFPSDELAKDPDSRAINPGAKRKRAAQSSAMENFDPDALPRPSGVIPLRVSSNAKDKTQLFRGEHSLEPVEGDDDVAERREKESNDSSKTETKKLFLYDGGNQQVKEPWDFNVEGADTKLDQIVNEDSLAQKKLVAYDGGSVVKDKTDRSQSTSTKKDDIEVNDRKLKEETVSPFTRNVSMNKETRRNVDTSDGEDDSTDTQA